MSTTLQTNELTLRTSIIQKINLIFNDEEYTFEAFILMKGNHILKKFVLYEGVPQRRNDTSVNFKKKLQLSIAESIRRKFADESAEYDHVDNIANNQNKFYVIPQTTDYSPFAAVCTTIQTYDSYRVTDRENAEGIFFRYQRGEQIIWAYQYFWPNAIPNRKGLAFHVIPQDDVFTELKKPILAILPRSHYRQNKHPHNRYPAFSTPACRLYNSYFQCLSPDRKFHQQQDSRSADSL